MGQSQTDPYRPFLGRLLPPPLSDRIFLGIPLRAVNHFKHMMNVSVVIFVTTSRCMARVTQHVKRHIHTLLASFEWTSVIHPGECKGNLFLNSEGRQCRRHGCLKWCSFISLTGDKAVNDGPNKTMTLDYPVIPSHFCQFPSHHCA